MWIVTIKVLEESWLWPHCCVPFRLKAIKKPRFQEGTVTLVVNLGLGLRSSQHQPCGEAGCHPVTYMIYRFWGREAGWKSQLIGWSQTMLEDSSWLSNQEEGQDLLVLVLIILSARVASSPPPAGRPGNCTGAELGREHGAYSSGPRGCGGGSTDCRPTTWDQLLAMPGLRMCSLISFYHTTPISGK